MRKKSKVFCREGIVFGENTAMIVSTYLMRRNISAKQGVFKKWRCKMGRESIIRQFVDNSKIWWGLLRKSANYAVCDVAPGAHFGGVLFGITEAKTG